MEPYCDTAIIIPDLSYYYFFYFHYFNFYLLREYVFKFLHVYKLLCKNVTKSNSILMTNISIIKTQDGCDDWDDDIDSGADGNVGGEGDGDGVAGIVECYGIGGDNGGYGYGGVGDDSGDNGADGGFDGDVVGNYDDDDCDGGDIDSDYDIGHSGSGGVGEDNGDTWNDDDRDDSGGERGCGDGEDICCDNDDCDVHDVYDELRFCSFNIDGLIKN